MPWVKLTDDWYDDPAIAAAGALGVSMWVVGLSWCARNLTDGHIPRSQVRKLVDLDDISVDGAKCRADDIAGLLVELGLWSRTDTGYVVENYHRYQPARSKVLADREKDRQRKTSRSGDLLADVARPNGIQPESKSIPDPSRLPSPTDTSLTSSNYLQGTVDNSDDDGVPAETWEQYAQIKLDRQPPGKVSNPDGYKRSTAKNGRHEHGETALRWWRDFDVRPRQLAEWLVDGKPSPHAKRRKENT